MFEYFPDNYGWSLAVMLAVTSGGAISEIDEACRPLRALAGTRGPDSSIAWVDRWRTLAEKVHASAEVDAQAQRGFSAGRKYARACIYFVMAERQMRHADPQRSLVYRRMLDAFARWQNTLEQPVERCLVPYEGTTLPAFFVRAEGSHGAPAPCLVMFDGFDVMKEIMCLMDVHTDFKRRGVSLLIVDHPGVGEALRVQKLKAFPEYERPASACVDYLEQRRDVDAKRIGIIALSAGGYFAPRAAAFEPRLACCICWTGVWSWGGVFERRLRGALPQALDFHLEHAEWVYGVTGADAVLEVVHRMTMEGIADRIRCPLLVTHGGSDRQTPVDEARRLFDAAVNASRRELRIFSEAEGGDQHCHADNQTLGTDFMADWASEVLGGHRSRAAA